MRRRWSPASVGRVLDDAFGLYRAHFRLVVATALVTVFPVAVIVGLTQAFVTRGMLALIPEFGTAGGDALESLLDLQVLSLASNATAPLFWVARVFLACVLLHAAGSLYAGRAMGLRDMLSVGWSRALTFALVTFVLTAGATILLFFGIVPGIIFAARFALAPAAVAVEGAGFEGAFRRSWALTGGHAWRVIGFYVLVSVFALVLETTVTSPSVSRQLVASIGNPEAIFAPVSAWWKTVEGILSAAAVTLVIPFAELAWFFFYADLRARREGMDLVVRAAELAEARG